MAKKRPKTPEKPPKPRIKPLKHATRCHSCQSDKTYVYDTKRVIRYCRCRQCGFSWSQAITVDEIQTR
jgi:transcription elongation factor Elf1